MMGRLLPALIYHHVTPQGGDRLTVDVAGFEAQVRYLVEEGYTTLHAAEYVRCLRGEAQVPARAVLLTLDDGYLDTWAYAFPILRRYNAKATLFLVTGWISEVPGCRKTLEDVWAGSSATALPALAPHDTTRSDLASRGSSSRWALTWDEVAAMARGGLMDIQSHTHTHPLCRVGQEIDEAKLREELRKSREAIEGHLGTSCRYLCWPRGWFNEAALRIACEEGYEACFSTVPGANGPQAHPGALRRIDVRRGGAAWLGIRLFLYTHPRLASVYLRLKGRGHHVPSQW